MIQTEKYSQLITTDTCSLQNLLISHLDSGAQKILGVNSLVLKANLIVSKCSKCDIGMRKCSLLMNILLKFFCGSQAFVVFGYKGNVMACVPEMLGIRRLDQGADIRGRTGTVQCFTDKKNT